MRRRALACGTAWHRNAALVVSDVKEPFTSVAYLRAPYSIVVYTVIKYRHTVPTAALDCAF